MAVRLDGSGQQPRAVLYASKTRASADNNCIVLLLVSVLLFSCRLPQSRSASRSRIASSRIASLVAVSEVDLSALYSHAPPFTEAARPLTRRLRRLSQLPVITTTYPASNNPPILHPTSSTPSPSCDGAAYSLGQGPLNTTLRKDVRRRRSKASPREEARQVQQSAAWGWSQPV